MPHRAIAGLIPTMQGIALVGHNLSVVKKKKIGTKDIVGLGVTNIVGTSLLQTEAQLVGDL